MSLNIIYESTLADKSVTVQNNTSIDHNHEINVLNFNFNTNKPEAAEHEILACFQFDDRKNNGDIKKEMRFIATLIKACANARMSALEAAGYNHLNSAVVLFHAEFADWANKTAKRKIDETLYKELGDRIYYLNRIEEENIFRNEPKQDWAVNALIFNLKQLLENGVVPKIKTVLNQQSSREIFTNLVKSAENFFTTAVQAIFSLYVENAAIADFFEIENSTLIQHNGLLEIMQTPFGNLFHILNKYFNHTLNNYDINNINPNPFINNEGGINYIFISDFLTTKKTGVHTLILNSPRKNVFFSVLIENLGLLTDFIYLIRAFQYGYSLAGDGGDLLMYIGLCQEINFLVACFGQLKSKLIDAITNLKQLSKEIYNILILEQEWQHDWKNNYLRARRCFNQAEENLNNCHNNICELIQKMQNIHLRDYQDEIEQKILFFQKTITHILRRTGMQTSATYLEDQINKKSRNNIFIYESPSLISNKNPSDKDYSNIKNSESTIIPECNSNNPNWYSDRNICDYLEAKVIQELNGYSPGCSMLLRNQFTIKNKNYFVAITGAVDTIGKSTSIDYFIDKAKQPEPVISTQDDRHDVFDEIIPLFQQDCNVIILFPYNQTQWHWLTGEININKEGNSYTIKIFAHDPYARQGRMEQDNFNTLRDAVSKRIKSFDGEAVIKDIENSLSRYGQRQAYNDGDSCGVIVCEDIIRRIRGLDLVVDGKPYPVGTKELRERHAQVIANNRSDTSIPRPSI